jgi:hypothetical protein
MPIVVVKVLVSGLRLLNGRHNPGGYLLHHGPGSPMRPRLVGHSHWHRDTLGLAVHRDRDQLG